MTEGLLSKVMGRKNIYEQSKAKRRFLVPLAKNYNFSQTKLLL